MKQAFSASYSVNGTAAPRPFSCPTGIDAIVMGVAEAIAPAARQAAIGMVHAYTATAPKKKGRSCPRPFRLTVLPRPSGGCP